MSRGGNAPRLSGQAWESILQFMAARDPGIVLVKQHPETKFFGKGQGRVVAPAWVDYMGSCYGSAFTCEAKSTGNKSRLKAPRDRMHQFMTMRGVSRYLPGFYFVHWTEYDQAEAFVILPDSPWPFWMDRGEGEVSHGVDLDELWLEGFVHSVIGAWVDKLTAWEGRRRW